MTTATIRPTPWIALAIVISAAALLPAAAQRGKNAPAKNDPSKENAFRQFRLNQWVSQASRWMPMHLWDKCTGDLWMDPTWGRQKSRTFPTIGNHEYDSTTTADGQVMLGAVVSTTLIAVAQVAVSSASSVAVNVMLLVPSG